MPSTMPTEVTLKLRQILRLLGQIILMLHPHIQRQLYSAEDQASPSNLTKYCLPRKITLMIDPRQSWNVIYIARGNKTNPPTSPNTSFLPAATHFVLKIPTFRAPVIYLTFTKYCACHEKWHCSICED